MLEKYLQIHPEVQKALASGEPVVGLESSIISHGLSYPKNIERANNVCKMIRDNGAIPATIAIINGILKVGLTQEDLELIAINRNIIKTSKKDLPFIISKKLTATTTIDSTIILANLAEIKVIAIQEDLNNTTNFQELTNTEVAVVYSESVSEIDSTLRHLENTDVTVVEYEVNNIDDFKTIKSRFNIDYKVKSSIEIAKALKIKWDLGLKGGMLISNSTNQVKLACDIANDLSTLYKLK